MPLFALKSHKTSYFIYTSIVHVCYSHRSFLPLSRHFRDLIPRFNNKYECASSALKTILYNIFKLDLLLLASSKQSDSGSDSDGITGNDENWRENRKLTHNNTKIEKFSKPKISSCARVQMCWRVLSMFVYNFNAGTLHLIDVLVLDTRPTLVAVRARFFWAAHSIQRL